MAEILIVVAIIWVLGIILFAWGITDLVKNDPRMTDAFRMNAEMNPVGIIMLSAAIVCWPAYLLIRMADKR